MNAKKAYVPEQGPLCGDLSVYKLAYLACLLVHICWGKKGKKAIFVCASCAVVDKTCQAAFLLGESRNASFVMMVLSNFTSLLNVCNVARIFLCPPTSTT